MAERPSVKGAIAKQLDPDGLSVISNCLAIRMIAHYPIPHLLVYPENSILSKFPLVLKPLKLKDYYVIDLYNEIKSKISIKDYIEVLDCLFAMNEIQVFKEVIHYVKRDSI